MTPTEVEYAIAGALWRDERLQDRLARLELALVRPWAKEPVYLSDLIGSHRRYGESRIPGYRADG